MCSIESRGLVTALVTWVSIRGRSSVDYMVAISWFSENLADFRPSTSQAPTGALCALQVEYGQESHAVATKPRDVAAVSYLKLVHKIDTMFIKVDKLRNPNFRSQNIPRRT